MKLHKFKIVGIFILLVVLVGTLSACNDEGPADTEYTLTIKVEGEGSVEPNAGSYEYEEGTIVDLKAISDEGWEFSKWEGNVKDSKAKETKILMEDDETVTAVFEDNSENTIKFGYISWPGQTIKTEIAKIILEEIGYKVENNSFDQENLFNSLGNEEIDLTMGVWLPLMEYRYQPYKNDNLIVPLVTNLEEIIYKTYVNQEAYEAGVTSMTDLNKYADKFDKTIYGIEPGNEGNIIIKNAIENDTYNLNNWKLNASSTAGMLDMVEQRLSNDKWVAFNGWEPHYMQIMFDIHPLTDPEGIWGEPEKVKTVMRNGFGEEFSNVKKLMTQMTVKNEWQSKWIYEYLHKGKKPNVVAKEWITQNLNTAVKNWVEGVYTADQEKSAFEVLKNSFSEN